MAQSIEKGGCMEVKELADLIQNIGYPISVSLACFFFINNIIKQNREDNVKREEMYFKQLEGISNSLSKVTELIAVINERLERLEDDNVK